MGCGALHEGVLVGPAVVGVKLDKSLPNAQLPPESETLKATRILDLCSRGIMQSAFSAGQLVRWSTLGAWEAAGPTLATSCRAARSPNLCCEVPSWNKCPPPSPPYLLIHEWSEAVPERGTVARQQQWQLQLAALAQMGACQ